MSKARIDHGENSVTVSGVLAPDHIILPARMTLHEAYCRMKNENIKYGVVTADDLDNAIKRSGRPGDIVTITEARKWLPLMVTLSEDADPKDVPAKWPFGIVVVDANNTAVKVLDGKGLSGSFQKAPDKTSRGIAKAINLGQPSDSLAGYPTTAGGMVKCRECYTDNPAEFLDRQNPPQCKNDAWKHSLRWWGEFKVVVK